MDIKVCPAKGFTLLELLVAITITSILISVVIPGFGSMLDRNQMAFSVNTLVSNLHLARSEAVKRERWVSVCPSSDGVSCLPDYTKWGEGFILFVNNNRDKIVDPDEPIIAVSRKKFDGIVVQTSSNNRNVITYRPDGRAWNFNTTMRFCFKDSRNENRAIIIAPNGRLRVSHKMSNNSPITCDGVH